MRKNKYTHIALTICSAAVLASTSAYAGFEFTGPVTPQQSTSNQPSNGNLLPTIDEMETLPPVAQPDIEWGNDQNAAPTQPNAPVVQSPLAEQSPTKPQVAAPSPSSRETAPTGIMSMAPKSSMTQQQAPSAPQPMDNTFRLQAAPTTAASSTITPPVSNTEQTAPSTAPVVDNNNAQYDMAVGFGKDLPLISALRQVIPPEYTYVLSSSVDSGQKVSWNGGQQWPNVLNDMLTPTGLNANISGNIVTIRQGQGGNNAMQPVAETEVETTENLESFATVNNEQSSEQPSTNNSMFVKSYTPVSSMSQAQPNNIDNNRRPPVLTRMEEETPPTAFNTENAEPVSLQPSQSNFNATPVAAQEPVQEQTAPTPWQQPRSPSANIAVSTTDTPETPRPPQAPQDIEESEGQWMAQSGTSLKTVLESWANLEGVDLFWSSDYDYILAGDVNINGTFESAVKTLLEGFSEAQPKPIGRLHPNLPNGPAVLVIETRKIIG